MSAQDLVAIFKFIKFRMKVMVPFVPFNDREEVENTFYRELERAVKDVDCV